MKICPYTLLAHARIRSVVKCRGDSIKKIDKRIFRGGRYLTYMTHLQNHVRVPVVRNIDGSVGNALTEFCDKYQSLIFSDDDLMSAYEILVQAGEVL